MKIIPKINLICIFFIVCSCSQTKSISSEPKTLPVDSISDSERVYFKADGTEPFWGLTISEKEIILKTMEDTLAFTYKEPVKAEDSNIKVYKLESASLEMNIQIRQTECSNNMSGKLSPYTVDINYKKKTALANQKLKGCGSYITDFRLNNIWILEVLNGKKVEEINFKVSLPSIEISAENNSFSGFAGCNQISGQVFYEKGILRFVETISTMMYCGNKNKEKEFIKALSSATNYSIENNHLKLFNSPSELLRFIRND